MSRIEKTEIINTSNISTQFGLLSGLLMAGFLFLMQLSGNDYKPFLKLFNYVLFAVPIIVALNIYKKRIIGDIFINGISFGAKLSFVAGLVLALINIVLYLFDPQIAFSKYGLEPSNLTQVVITSAIIFFETFVFGNLIAFITLQYLKGKYKNIR